MPEFTEREPERVKAKSNERGSAAGRDGQESAAAHGGSELLVRCSGPAVRPDPRSAGGRSGPGQPNVSPVNAYDVDPSAPTGTSPAMVMRCIDRWCPAGMSVGTRCAVARLSQNAMLPGCQRNRQVNVDWRDARRASPADARSLGVTFEDVTGEVGVTNSTRSPVSDARAQPGERTQRAWTRTVCAAQTKARPERRPGCCDAPRQASRSCLIGSESLS